MGKIRLETIADELASTAGLSKKSARAYTGFVFKALTEHLAKGDTVMVTSFGTFSTTVCAARTGRNPETGEITKVPPKHRIKFEMSRKLLAEFNAEAGIADYDDEAGGDI